MDHALVVPAHGGDPGICARIGRVTGNGLAANIRKITPSLFFISSCSPCPRPMFSTRGPISAPWERPGPARPENLNVLDGTFGIFSLLVVLFVPYTSYAKYLKWLTLSLLAYIGVVFLVRISWREVLHATLFLTWRLTANLLMAIVAVLGTTISPYLFFWQASQEAEEVKTTAEKKR